MAHRTFFSFHYERDVWRASIVRNSDVTKRDVNAEWIDASMWEEAKQKGREAIKRLIDSALPATTVTVVLIGSETASRSWVQYEIDQSTARGNGMLGVYIHNIEDRSERKATRGANPLSPEYPTYDWVNDNGYRNLGVWVDRAYDAAH